MPEIRLDLVSRRIASLAYSMLYGAGALWLMVGELAHYQGHLSEDYQTGTRIIVLSTIVLLVCLAAQRGLWSRSPKQTGIAWLTIWTIVDFSLFALIAWTWWRGVNSRLLLAGGGDLLAIVSVMLVLQAVWHGIDGWLLYSNHTVESASSPPRSNLPRHLDVFSYVAAVLLLIAWLRLELLSLPT